MLMICDVMSSLYSCFVVIECIANITKVLNVEKLFDKFYSKIDILLAIELGMLASPSSPITITDLAFDSTANLRIEFLTFGNALSNSSKMIVMPLLTTTSFGVGELAGNVPRI